MSSTRSAAPRRRTRGVVGLLTATIALTANGMVASAQTADSATPPSYSATYRVERGSSSGSATSTTTAGSTTTTASANGSATIRLDCTDVTTCKVVEFVNGAPPWIETADILPFSISAVGSGATLTIPDCGGARANFTANLEPVGTTTVAGVRYPASLAGTLETGIAAGTDDSGAPCGAEKWTYTFAKSATTATTVPAGPAFTPNPKKKVSLRLSGGVSATINGNKANCLGDLVGISGRNYPALGSDGFLEFRRDGFSRGKIAGEVVTGDPPTFTKKNTILTFDTPLQSASSSSTFEVLLEGRIKCARFGA